MDIQVKNHTFYFGKVTDRDEVVGYPIGWQKGWDFRVTIDTDNEQIEIEDTCNRMVPVSFDNLWELVKTLHSVQDEIVASVIGAPRAVS